MPPQPETREPDFSGRVITALTDLAALSRRISLLRLSLRDALDQCATSLISCLVTACEAQQGALFLVQQDASQDAATCQGAWANQPAFALIAGVQMSEEEARTALATYPLGAAPLQWFVDCPPTLVWRRLLPALDEAAKHPVFQPYALLLLIWPEPSEHTQERRCVEREQAMHLLPFLTDAVDTILLHVSVALNTREPSDELLPAELLATIGHEFRGPLTTITGYATTLLRHEQQLASEERQDFLRAISAASTHLGKLVNRCLELGQLESHRATFIPASVDLVSLVHEASTVAQKTRSHLRILTPSLPPASSSREQGKETSPTPALTVCGDRRWLGTMLEILLENAVAYSAPESLIEVSIALADPAPFRKMLRTLPGPDNHAALILPGAFAEHETLLEIRVRDYGIGIEPRHLARIFQRFYRVDTRLTREVNGLGLGLALCKAIVAWHRGMLWVESMLGTGSTFHILLPYEAGSPSSAKIERRY